VAQQRAPQLTNALAEDARVLDPAWVRRERLVAFAAYPLLVEDRLIGVLAMVSREPLAQDTLEGLASVADVIATGVDRKRAEAERERLIGALERSNRELDQFAYAASHDLKAPLRGIGNLSEWLEEDLGQKLDASSREHLRLLRGRVHRMEALIDGILDYSRAGRVRYKPERVEVRRLLLEVAELLAPPASATVEVPAELPVLETQRVPLQQVFLNLVGNAHKHARRADPLIRVGVADEGRFHRFSVSDNGQGIAPEFHERIWGIFQVLEARDKVEGTGIGLAVVKKIVESRGGRAWVESAAGAGATFHFTWPKREAGAA
jgi:light-regulated signal transduction histidine kinase (bacteriophytochrome)